MKATNSKRHVSVHLPYSYYTIAVIMLVLFLALGMFLIESPFTVLQLIVFIPAICILIFLVWVWQWSVEIDDKILTVKKLFFKRSYSWSQVKNVYIRNYIGDQCKSIEIFLSNGKRFRVRSDCRNFTAFQNELIKHKTVRS